MRETFDFRSSDEVDIRGYYWYNPERDPKAVVIIAHGMADYILRYEAFAVFLVSMGYAVFGHSHRGHGDSVARLDQLGYLNPDGWSRMVDDFEIVIHKSQTIFEGKSIILLGHSLGSYIVRDLMTRNVNDITGVILSGTGYPNGLQLKSGALMAKWELNRRKKDMPSKRLDQMTFGKYNKRIANAKTSFDWLSRDENMVDSYIQSPYCGQVHSTVFFKEMAENLYRIVCKDKPTFNEGFPVFLISGQEDPVGAYGKGVAKTAVAYAKLGGQVRIKLYSGGRHEMLNETNKQEVYADILNWLNQII